MHRFHAGVFGQDGERERGVYELSVRQTDGDRNRERQKETQRGGDRQTDTERVQTERVRDRERGQRDRQTQKQTVQTETVGGSQGEMTQTYRDRNRHTRGGGRE